MALPRLNDTPKYSMVIPSNGKKIRYRPYLVKEEKVLMLANESGDLESIVNAMIEAVVSCCTPKLDPKLLTTFDMEYLFMQIRAVSVGETSDILLTCPHCETDNEITVNVKEAYCKEVEKNPKVKLSKEISLEMRYPSYSDFDFDNENIVEEFLFNSIDAVCTKEERLPIKEESKEEIRAFLDSLTSDQLTSIDDFISEMPVVTKEVNFKCGQCDEEQDHQLQGIRSFF